MDTKTEPSILAFPTAECWREWLEKNHSVSPGVWLRFFKKASGVATVSYAEALDEALCYGWIDGQLKKHDERFYLRKFTAKKLETRQRRLGAILAMLENGEKFHD